MGWCLRNCATYVMMDFSSGLSTSTSAERRKQSTNRIALDRSTTHSQHLLDPADEGCPARSPLARKPLPDSPCCPCGAPPACLPGRAGWRAPPTGRRVRRASSHRNPSPRSRDAWRKRSTRTHSGPFRDIFIMMSHTHTHTSGWQKLQRSPNAP